MHALTASFTSWHKESTTGRMSFFTLKDSENTTCRTKLVILVKEFIN